MSKKDIVSLTEPPSDLGLEPETGSESLGAWFLGPKGENESLLLDLVARAVRSHCQDRRKVYPEDPLWVTERVKSTPEYQTAVRLLRQEFNGLLAKLDGSVPFFSYRYQGHMLWDVTLPALVGYLAALLYNQNNVAAEASPITTWLEMEVGDDLCRMLGFDPSASDDGRTVRAWGHITCDGSVANIESMWAARNLKYYPLAIREAAGDVAELGPVLDLEVGYAGEMRRFGELDRWELLNLAPDDVLAIPQRLRAQKVSEDALDQINKYSVQELGFPAFHRAGEKSPAIICPGTMHYSWPKGASLLGLGRDALIDVPVDLEARMNVRALEEALQRRLADRNPVLMVVAVAGSTMEGAVDPVRDILELRRVYRQKGLDFVVHADAAWGGYFASMLSNQRSKGTLSERKPGMLFCDACPPEYALSDYVIEQLKALAECDSITVDPHKSGYIPYPAGGLCYRNAKMRDMVRFTAPVVYHGGVAPTVGVFGIEGSKPGAAAAATYLSHRVIRTNQRGYGQLLGRCVFNASRFYAALAVLAEPEDPFVVVPLRQLPDERLGGDGSEDRRRIRLLIAGKTNEEILDNREANDVLRGLGSDSLIVTYAFNFRLPDGTFNVDLSRCNALNKRLFERLSVQDKETDPASVPLTVTGGELTESEHGKELIQSFGDRLGVKDHAGQNIDILISTIMNPWLTDTEDGNFLPALMGFLRQVILEEVQNLHKEAL